MLERNGRAGEDASAPRGGAGEDASAPRGRVGEDASVPRGGRRGRQRCQGLRTPALPGAEDANAPRGGPARTPALPGAAGEDPGAPQVPGRFCSSYSRRRTPHNSPELGVRCTYLNFAGPSLLTIYHILTAAGALSGFALGMAAGFRLSGVPGAVGGSLAGGLLGWCLGRVPELLVWRSIARDLTRLSAEELRADLRRADCRFPNCVLLELQSRGEEIRSELPVVLRMLESEDYNCRCRGWAALTSAYPELAALIADYRVTDGLREQHWEALRTVVHPGPAP